MRIGNFLRPTVIDRTYSRMDEVHVGLSLRVCAFEIGDWESLITRDFICNLGVHRVVSQLSEEIVGSLGTAWMPRDLTSQSLGSV